MSSDIKPKMVDGEPVCSGEDCHRYGECDWPYNAPPIGDTCIPGLRNQLKQIKQELTDTRAIAEWLKGEAIKWKSECEQLRQKLNMEMALVGAKQNSIDFHISENIKLQKGASNE